jgi:hypothetical protein
MRRGHGIGVIVLPVICACSSTPGGGGLGVDATSSRDAATSDVARADAAAPDLGQSALDASADDLATSPDAADLGDADMSDAIVLPDANALDATAPDAAQGMVRMGVLVGGEGPWPGPIEGVRFTSGGQSGFTDMMGTFSYEDGTPIVFGIGSVQTRPVNGAPELSPFALSGTCTVSTALEALLVLMDSLDTDHDPSNGVQLEHYPPGSPVVPLDTLTVAGADMIVTQLMPGALPITATTALDRFILQVDGEVWQELSHDTFTGSAWAQRSQGGATDGTSWYFSWRFGVSKTDDQFNVTVNNMFAIPGQLLLAGDNHIGDIDVHNGLIYAGVEDGSTFQQPHVVTYDTTMLMSQTIYALPLTSQTQGVPWVAVDGPRNALYASHWDPVPEINVYDLSSSSLAFVKAISLRPALGRIQGGKVFEGSLYVARDDTAKSIEKINLDTGTVVPLFQLNLTGDEQEGLIIRQLPDGSLMHTLNTNSSQTDMEFHHHQRTRPPLRKQLCP